MTLLATLRCMTADTTEIVWVGASNHLQSWGMAVDTAGNVYLAGTTDRTNASAPLVFQLGCPNSGTNDSQVFVLKLDPTGTPVFITYFGGSGWDAAYGIAVDATGIYVAGYSDSTNFPITNAVQSTLTGASSDGFVAKLDPSGSALLFSTYLGGTAEDYCIDVKVDAEGRAVVIGNTGSTNFPTRNALQPTNATLQDVVYYGPEFGPYVNETFVAKLESSGTALVYSTYLGGDKSDWANALALDGAGNAYITGQTTSTNFPTRNAFQAEIASTSGYGNAFLTKLNSAGTALVYSTYLGGNSGDWAYTIDVDLLGRAWVGGATSSPDFPLVNPLSAGFIGTKPYLFQPAADGFVTQFSADGRDLAFSTYLGGEDDDDVTSLAVDGEGKLWLAGYVGKYAAGSYLSGPGYVAALGSNASQVTFTAQVPACGVGQVSNIAVATNGVVWINGSRLSDEGLSGHLGSSVWESFVARIATPVTASNPSPLVQIARPANAGLWGTNSLIPLLASASDLGGRVARVEFYADGQWIGAVTNIPYGLSWRSSTLGEHTIVAVAVGHLGAMATSCPVRVTVVVPPANDLFENCTPIFGVGLSVTGAMTGASIELGEPSNRENVYPSSRDLSRTLWWCWSAPSNGTYTLWTRSEVTGSVLGPGSAVWSRYEGTASVRLYQGHGLNDLTLVADRIGQSSWYPSNQRTFQATTGVVCFIHAETISEFPGEVVFGLRAANPPPNDDFENRINLTGLTVDVAGSNAEATQQTNEPSIDYFKPESSVWWSWIAPTNGAFLVTAESTNFYPLIGVFTVAYFEELQLITASDWTESPYRAALTFQAEAGRTYPIVIADRDGESGGFRLRIEPVAPPPNDNFAQAFALTGSQLATNGTTFGATTEANDPIGPPAQTVWWRWTPDIAGTFSITVTSSNQSPTVAVYTGAVPVALTKVTDGDYRNDGRYSAILRAQAGIEYRLMVESHAAAGGGIELQINPVVTPPNDDFENRIALTGQSVVITGTTTNATRGADEPILVWYLPPASVWWSWVAPVSGEYVLRVNYAEAYPWVQVFAGDSLSNLTARSSVLYGYAGQSSDTIFSADAGEVLQIIVASRLSEMGAFSLQLQPAPWLPLNPPANDSFSNRIELTGTTVEVQGSVVDAAIEPGEPAPCSGGVSAWWSWIAPSSGLVTITAGTNGTGPSVTVYAGTNLPGLTRIVSGASGEVTFRAEPGVPYALAIGQCRSANTNFTLRIRPACPPVNDDFARRIPLTEGYVVVKGSNADATVEPGEPGSFPWYRPPPERTVWWSWTAPADGRTTVTATVLPPGTQSDPWLPRLPPSYYDRLAVFTGESVNALTRIGDWVFQAVAGTTYHIRVGSSFTDTGEVTLTINGPRPAAQAQMFSAHAGVDGFEMQFSGTPWRTHTLQYSTDLIEWLDLLSIPAMSLENRVVDPNSTDSVRFYRLKSY